jgi:C4-dicarboxylate transporter DctM subunit
MGVSVLLISLMAFGAPIALAFAAAALIALHSLGFPLSIVPQRLFGSMDSFTLLSIPLFILAGELMSTSGISQRLVDLAKVMVGHLRGGMGMVAVVSEYFFSGVSGSAVADTAAIGSLMVPAMAQSGYTRQKAVGVVCGACAMGILVPPSISMVLYGGLANVSIGALFIAGFLPALVTALAMLVHIGWEARRLKLPLQPRPTVAEVFLALRRSVLALMMPVIIFAGILGGAFTATEAAAVAVSYALLLDLLVYREITLARFGRILVDTVRLTGVVVFLIACSSLFAWYLTVQEIPQALARAIIEHQLGAITVLFLLFAVFFVLGMIMDGIAAMVMVVPLILPILPAVGIDPIHLGVIIVATCGLGLFTPPVGAGLFVACAIGRVSIEEATAAMTPYLVTITLCIVVLILVPEITTVLPWLFGIM